MAKNSRVRKVFLISLAFLVLALAALAGTLAYLAPRLNEGLAAALSEKTGRPVQLEEFTWSLWPRPRFQGRGLVVGAREGEGDAPAAEVGEFTVETGILQLLAEPRSLDAVRVRDLVVRIRRGRPASAQPPQPSEPKPAPRLPIDIGRVEAENIRIEISGDDPEQSPRVFLLPLLVLESLDFQQRVTYQARFQNQRPAGPVELQGEFGPWNAEEPRLTPYSGSFHLQNADMSVFKGLRGVVDARGRFQGSVQKTRVEGEAVLPDFSVARSGNVVPLRSRFVATVGRGGAVIELDEVETSFLQSTLLTQGSVSRESDAPGRTVRLRVSGHRARVQDLVQFAVQADPPPLTGAIELETDIEIPPGSERFIERMKVAGRFQIREGKFSNVSIQDTLARISRIGSGDSETEAASGSSVVSDMKGQFRLAEERIDFSQLDFSVPGMELSLTGTYGVPDQTLDFRGTALLERPPSEMVSGEASKWVRILDPLLGGDKGGTKLPVVISGTRSKPRFSIDFKRLGR